MGKNCFHLLILVNKCPSVITFYYSSILKLKIFTINIMWSGKSNCDSYVSNRCSEVPRPIGWIVKLYIEYTVFEDCLFHQKYRLSDWVWM